MQPYDLDRPVAVTEGYVGAEIEPAVIDAMCLAYNDPTQPRRDFTTEDIFAALARQVPISRSQRKVIGDLRQWLDERCTQSASFREVRQVQEQFVPLPLDLRQES